MMLSPEFHPDPNNATPFASPSERADNSPKPYLKTLPDLPDRFVKESEVRPDNSHDAIERTRLEAVAGREEFGRLRSRGINVPDAPVVIGHPEAPGGHRRYMFPERIMGETLQKQFQKPLTQEFKDQLEVFYSGLAKYVAGCTRRSPISSQQSL